MALFGGPQPLPEDDDMKLLVALVAAICLAVIFMAIGIGAGRIYAGLTRKKDDDKAA